MTPRPSLARDFISTLAPPPAPEDLGAWGGCAATDLTDRVDRLIQPVLAALDPLSLGVYAVGGYGRRELAPWSDVDILFITSEQSDLSGTIAELWNLGIRPSVLVRGGGELAKSTESDFKFATTLLDARHLHGIEPPLLLGRRSWIPRLRKAYHREHELERRQRHLKFRGAGHQEPHLRDGRGGMRDFQMHRWLAAARDAEQSGAGADADDYAILLAARIVLHAALGRREDRLLIADRVAVESWLGWPDPTVFWNLAARAMKRIALRRTGLEPKRSPEAVRLEFLRRLTDVPLRPIAGFLRLLDEEGEMESLVPEWRRIDGLMRSDAAHWYTVEEHTLRTVEQIETLYQERLRAVSVGNIQRHDLLVLAALFHDIGKGSGAEHAHVGAEVAGVRMKEWGFAETEIDRVRFLVEQHALLSYNALRRDVDDPSLIHELARRIGDVENLAMLHVLTIADMKAVSNEMYTEWKANLLDTLGARLERQCASYLPPDLFALETLARRRSAVEMMLGDPDLASDIDTHFCNIDARYAMAHTPEQIARHIRLLPRLEADGLAIERLESDAKAWSEITVITRSHYGLFAEIAGTLSARGFNILSADISTRCDGIAIDSFRVSKPPGGITEERWRSFEADLRRVTSGEAAVERIISERRPYQRQTEVKPAEVRIDNESSLTHTIFEVMAPDETGLLYRFATVFRDCGINLTSAIVNTEGEVAVDVFYVTGGDGAKITHTGLLDKAMKLLADRNNEDQMRPSPR